MKAEDAIAVANYLAAAYRVRLSDEELAVWVDQLGGVPRATGTQAAREFAGADREFMPHPGQVVSRAREIGLRMRAEQPTLPEESESTAAQVTTAEEAKANIARLKDMITKDGPKRVDEAGG